MELRVVSPIKQSSYTIAWLEAYTEQGSFVIQSGHAPMIVLLVPGEPLIFMLTNGERHSIPIGRGILETSRTIITVIMHEMT